MTTLPSAQNNHVLVAAALCEWFARKSRPLPWRETYDPYRVWISEVMLQQTQVDTVLPYYARFLERFPTVDSLARAPEDQVLSLWSGLGYYSRARNLMAAARRVVDDHDGRVPADYDQLIALPGIGRYMAGAILSIAFDRPWPIVDGNVRRVLSRLNGWEQPSDKQLWKDAEAIVSVARPRIVNQAMMELGATVCTSRNPDCAACPWETFCTAWASGRPESIPTPRKRPKTVRVDLAAIVDENPDGFLMREKDGLWEFPLLDLSSIDSSSLDSTSVDGLSKVGHCRHTITHHRIEVDVYRGQAAPDPAFRRVRFDDVPVTALTRKIHALGAI